MISKLEEESARQILAVCRTVAAFTIYLKSGGGYDMAYKTADMFIKQLKKDFEEKP